MGKRGKRKRSKIQDERERSDLCSGTSSTTSDLIISCEGDDDSRVVIPPPFSASHLSDNSMLGFISKSWTILENRKKTKWKPTAVQLHSWSLLLKTEIDLIAIAPTGTGKTYAYGLPLLSKVDSLQNGIQGIVLLPTRELALQVEKNLNFVRSPTTVVAVHGGADRGEQLTTILQDRPLVCAATPGRLGDFLKDERVQKRLHVKWIVFDEADRLALQADLAKQVNDVLKILGVDQSRRTCLFSATFPRTAAAWSSWIRMPHLVIKVNTVRVGSGESGKKIEEAERKSQSDLNVHALDDIMDDKSSHQSSKRKEGSLDLARIPSNVTQTLHVCANHKKPKKLMTILHKIRSNKEKRQQSLCIVFFAKIKTLQYISKLLKKEGIACTELHSHLNQKEREKVLFNFKCGKIDTLLATDVVARGIHVPNVDSVVNYDFPVNLEQYVHRCGRAGRSANKPATVYSFFHRELQPMANDVLTLLNETKAWIDPNLRELAGEKAAGNSRSKKRKRNQEMLQPNLSHASSGEDANEESDEDDQYAFLDPNRIVLDRASHVNDSSDSSDSREP
jgi:ATP-dependent RNA helicase DDX5/DBP2